MAGMEGGGGGGGGGQAEAAGGSKFTENRVGLLKEISRFRRMS